MSKLAKSAVLSLSLIAGAAVAAHAQSSSVASLPPGAGVAPATAATQSVGMMPGPNPGMGYYGGTVAQQQPVSPSPTYIGPNPGLGYYGTYSYHPDSNYSANMAAHPYTSAQGPRAN